MTEDAKVVNIEAWLADVRCFFTEFNPELLALFEIYSNEAVFGRKHIDNDLSQMRTGSRIIEIGAGSLLLSCQLVREGFDVTALEPVGKGFSHFNQMREVVLECAKTLGCCPSILNMPAEELNVSNYFDYAFSINVMEHVSDVECVIRNVGKSLTLGSCYRFTCPNYFFPYEPHFNFLTLISKELTNLIPL